MFSGIVSELGQVLEVCPSATGIGLKINVAEVFGQNLTLGCSIAVNGVCLTLTAFQNIKESVELNFIVVAESLNRSNLNQLETGSLVNLERSLRFGDEIGGHICSGHVDCRIEVLAVTHLGEARNIHFRVPEAFRKYIFEKGFVCVNGASITVAEKLQEGFSVALIPETLNRTNLKLLKQGSLVNLEIDRQTQAIVDTVQETLSRQNRE